MSELPKLSIALVTYQRTKEAVETVKSTLLNLKYPPELCSWYVGDDGSPKKHMDSIMRELDGHKILGYHNDRLRHAKAEHTYNCGMGWNRALGICHQNSDFVLWLEDDWNLEEPLDLVPFVRLLQEREDVGVVTFRVLSTGCDVYTVGHNGIHYLQYQKTTQYAYSGNPYLRHARFTKHYGWFCEECNPGEIELKCDDVYRLDNASGPWIWRPAAISPWGSWGHIGTEKSYQ